MTIDREVFLSLLALDAYNRGYGANVGGLPEMVSLAALRQSAGRRYLGLTLIKSTLIGRPLAFTQLLMSGVARQ